MDLQESMLVISGSQVKQTVSLLTFQPVLFSLPSLLCHMFVMVPALMNFKSCYHLKGTMKWL